MFTMFLPAVILCWLNKLLYVCSADGNVINVETVPTRLMSGGQEMLGPESTFIYNDREKNQMKEIWRVNIR